MNYASKLHTLCHNGRRWLNYFISFFHSVALSFWQNRPLNPFKTAHNHLTNVKNNTNHITSSCPHLSHRFPFHLELRSLQFHHRRLALTAQFWFKFIQRLFIVTVSSLYKSDIKMPGLVLNDLRVFFLSLRRIFGVNFLEKIWIELHFLFFGSMRSDCYA